MAFLQTPMTLAELRGSAGAELGYTEWREMTQQEVDRFAEATGDRQFIHVDPERAKETPWGGTIAHGFLTLSLLAPVTEKLLISHLTDVKMGVNYGLDRVRFPAPLPVGEQWRAGGSILEVTEVPGGVQIKLRITVEVRDSPKPACVAEFILRQYD